MNPAYELEHVADHPGRTAVLVVRTPGFAPAAYLPLLRALAAEREDVWIVSFPPREQTSADIREALRLARSRLPSDLDIVAHGVGATIALMSWSDLRPREMYLLAPVLAVPSGPPADALSRGTFGPAIDPRVPFPWNGGSLQDIIGVHDLEVVSGPLAREVLGWRPAPVDLQSVDVPVWVGFSNGDDVATVEDSLTASRALPRRRIERFGLNRFDPRDYEHGELLTERVPIHALLRAMR